MAVEHDLQINRLNLTDLDIHICGSQKCPPEHSYGPAIRDYFLVHYIHQGKGFFSFNKKKFYLQKGQGFVIWPEIISYYQADKKTPWQYSWIGFNGLKAEKNLNLAGISPEQPFFTVNNPAQISQLFWKMTETGNLKKSKEIKLTGLLYLFFAELIENNAKTVRNNEQEFKYNYLKVALNYIDRNYSSPDLKITDIAAYVGLNRSYLWEIFNELLEKSPQQYLIEFRIRKAAFLLKNYHLTVKTAAISVGYKDQYSFSKIFKKIMGCSPSKY
jgi:AraC-like DNA-binding protein